MLAQPAGVPVEFASALAVAGGFTATTEPQLLLGAVPEWAASRLAVPRRAEVLGAAFAGTTLVAVYAIDQKGPDAMKAFNDALKAGGWTPPPARGFVTQGGFRAAPIASASAPLERTTLCSTGHYVIVIPVRQSAGRTTIAMRLVTLTTTGQSICTAPQLPPGARPQRTAFPTVQHPAGSTNTQFCEPYIDGSSSGTSGAVRSSLSSENLVDHYAKQLRDSGWTDSGEQRTAITRVFTKPDSTGTPIHLELRVSRDGPDASCRNTHLMVRGASSGSLMRAP
jgi:hypothetical protein